MNKYRCTDCDEKIVKPATTVNVVGGYPCPNCFVRGAWMRTTGDTR
jgi:DNA-directed RNA polymerase subunit RPC12/RpoP